MPSKSELFNSLTNEEIDEFFKKNNAEKIILNKGEEVFVQGEKPEYLFILESGSVLVENMSSNGKRTIVNKFSESGTVFGEVYLYIHKNIYDYGCYTNEKSEIVRIPKKALMFDEKSDGVKIKIINNILIILSQKAYYLNQKLLIAGSFSIREKLARFFLQQNNEKNKLVLQFSREELADFLGATRPSISRELMNMANDGLIEVNKNNIKINKKELEKFL